MKNNRVKNAVYSVVLLAMMGVVWLYRQYNKPEPTHFAIEGRTMGTVYHIKYIDKEGRKLKQEVEETLKAFNQSLSTYIKTSEISKFNTNDSIKIASPYFYPVLARSKEIYKDTNGAFNPAIMPLVRAWGFGPDQKRDMNQNIVDSLLQYVDFESVTFDMQQVVKSKTGVQLDFSAIAKGYGVDVVAEIFLDKGINDFMVEIGGEVRCNGLNDKGSVWAIGIDNPKYKEEGESRLSKIVKIQNKALATSGNYRNFYVKDGKKYAHTIDPRTGYPVQHTLLSASVFAPDCMTADAYATSFMVLGKDSAIHILSRHPELEGILIYDDSGEVHIYNSTGVPSK